ncbi:MAG: c-type cytochrome [Parvularculaceae bacterium]|nr:c-type cytochrome [Parvularculaceae bacterium]
MRIDVAACAVSAFIVFGASASMAVVDDGEPRAAAASEGGGADAASLIERGAKLYVRKCGACHSPDANRIGPRHEGVYGRKSGSVPDFRYTKALGALDIVWDEETLDEWLTNPSAMAPGTAMGFRVTDAEERKAIIAYLKTL